MTVANNISSQNLRVRYIIDIRYSFCRNNSELGGCLFHWLSNLYVNKKADDIKKISIVKFMKAKAL
jgi:hypothetical protein